MTALAFDDALHDFIRDFAPRSRRIPSTEPAHAFACARGSTSTATHIHAVASTSPLSSIAAEIARSSIFLWRKGGGATIAPLREVAGKVCLKAVAHKEEEEEEEEEGASAEGTGKEEEEEEALSAERRVRRRH